MAIPDYPNNPAVDDEFTVGLVTFIWDGEKWRRKPLPSLSPDASNIQYDNTNTGMAAGNVQDAVDELYAGLTLDTTTSLINYSKAVPVGTISTTRGFTTEGDGGAGEWKSTGTTGLTPSQNPLARGKAELVDATGTLWVLADGIFDVRALGNFAEKYTVNVPSDQSTINAAITFLQRFKSNDGSTFEINLETGFVMNEEVHTYLDISNITLVSVDTTVTITRSALITELGLYSFGDRYAAFAAIGQGAALPVIDVLFQMDNTGMDSGVCAVAAINGGSVIVNAGAGCTDSTNGLFVFGAGAYAEANGANFSESRNDAGDGGSGVAAWYGAVVKCAGVTVDGSYYGIASDAARIECKNASAINCLRHGVRADEGGFVNCDGTAVDGAGVRGVYAWQGGVIHAKSVTATNCGSAAFAAINGGKVTCTGAVGTGSLQGIFSREGGLVEAGNFFGGEPSFVATGCTDTGIFCAAGSCVVAPGANVSGSVLGVDVDDTSEVSLQGINANNCTLAAIRVRDNSSANVSFGTATGSGGDGIVASNASNVHAAGTDVSTSIGQSIYSLYGSNINFRNGTAGTITVLGGSTIYAAGATGTLSKAANTLTVDGVIYQ